jgi:formyltetrahydrofolate-dependent phosphoribosylglycinamide formyltransferase
VTLRAAVFASGRGSNFRALVDYVRVRAEAASGHGKGGIAPSWSVVLLVTDRADSPALEIAREREFPSVIVPPEPDASSFADRLLAHLDEAGIDFILLAGYLRLIPPPVVRRFPGRILNLHPALLPAYGGKGMYGARVHQAVLDSGVPDSGATIHFVDEEYDRGRILAQGLVPVLPGDSAESLAHRIHEVEHRLYPETVNTLARALLAGRDPLALPTIIRRFHPVISAVEQP